MSPRPDFGYQSARILIVDDERHNRDLLEVMLKPEGFLLLTAANGEEALAIVAQRRVMLGVPHRRSAIANMRLHADA